MKQDSTALHRGDVRGGVGGGGVGGGGGCVGRYYGLTSETDAFQRTQILLLLLLL